MITHITRSVFLFFALLTSSLLFSQSNAAEDEFSKKKPETKFVEVVSTDSLGAGDLLKRANHWMSVRSDRYLKTGSSVTGTKTECLAVFPVKPKQLNPEVDYTGKITMKVIIECKNSRYRYTVSDIRHESKSGLTTAGSIDNEVPECGSVAMHDIMWRKLKAEALHNAALVVAEIKDSMSYDFVETNEDDW